MSQYYRTANGVVISNLPNPLWVEITKEEYDEAEALARAESDRRESELEEPSSGEVP